MFAEPRLSDQARLAWKWWDRFWLRFGLTLALCALFVESSRLFIGLPAPAAVTSPPCVAATRQAP